MTQQFHEGQEVEVAEIRGDPRPFRVWRKAKIVRKHWNPNTYEVQFPDDSRAVFDAEHIRAIRSAMESDGTAAELWPAEEYPGYPLHRVRRLP